MKRVLFLFLAAVMLFSLAACTKPSMSGTKEDTYSSDGRLVIEMFGVDLDGLQSPTKDTQAIMDVIEKKFNVDFEFLSGTSSSWQNLLGQYIGGGDVPDIFFHTRQEPSYSLWLDENYLFNYSDMLENYPNLKEAFGRFDEEDMKLYLGGDYYGYPIVMNSETQSEVINEHALYYRRDWYENVKDSYTPESGRALVDPDDENFNYLNFYDLCEAFTYGDPDGNGEDDTYGFAMNNDIYWMYPIFAMFGVDIEGWEQDESGKWLPECISDNAKEAAFFIADMLDKGLVNSDYASTSQETMKSEFVTGEAGMMVYQATYPTGESILKLMADVVEGNVEDSVKAMPVVTGADGEKFMFGYPNFYGFLSINNDCSDNLKSKILEIMDWMLSDEGMMLLNYGIEGTHYKMENGEIVSLLGKKEDGTPKVLYDTDVAEGIYRIKGLVSWSTVIPEDITYYDGQMQLLNTWGLSPYLKMDELYYASVDSSYSLTISTLEDQTDIAYMGIIKSGVSAQERESLWKTFVQTYTMRGDGYITAMNDVAEDMGK